MRVVSGLRLALGALQCPHAIVSGDLGGARVVVIGHELILCLVKDPINSACIWVRQAHVIIRTQRGRN